MQMTLWEKITWYLRNRGLKALCYRALEVLRGVPSMPPGGGVSPEPLVAPLQGPVTPDDLAHRVFFRQKALGVYPPQVASPRQVVMVTDSIGKSSLFGGVATSIILAAQVAREAGLALHIVTREEPAVESNVGIILSNAGIVFEGEVHFSFVSVHDNLAKVAIGPHDIIITTSWWTTESVKNALGTRNVFYLLQEDERMFYPLNDEHLRCTELLSDRSISVIVNSELLFRHLNQSGLPPFEDSAICFEPAFPHRRDVLSEAEGKQKLDFFFYARPGHARNLFYRGLEIVQAAIDRNVLDPAEWRIHFVGVSMPEFTLGDEVEVQTHAVFDWTGYIEFMAKMDLGLSLMYTPHPSYPPLDLAACGAVAVTNRCGVKQDLSRYSANILCGDVRVDSMVATLAEAVKLAKNRGLREQNLKQSALSRSWEDSMASVVDFVLRRSA